MYFNFLSLLIRNIPTYCATLYGLPESSGIGHRGKHLDKVEIGGSDTTAPINLTKRLGLITATRDVAGLRVLDIGCGAGKLVHALCRAGAKAQGIEYQADKIAEWQSQFPDDDRVVWGDAEQLDFGDETFDIVIMNEVLEHVPDDVQALREAFRVLKRGGLFFNFTPNRFYPIETHGFLAKGTGEHLSGLKFPFLPWLPLAVSRRCVSFWCRNYWPSDLRRLTRNAGFTILRHGFVWQTFENISGGKSRLVHKFAGQARMLANVLERTPLLRSFGVSQLLISSK